MRYDTSTDSTARRTLSGAARVLLALKLDGPLLVGLSLVAIYGLIVLYSASGQDWATVIRAAVRLGLGAVAMLALAQVRPQLLRNAAPWLFAFGVLLLIVVDVLGVIGKGAQRGSIWGSSASSPRK